jgi:hypothetical protein
MVATTATTVKATAAMNAGKGKLSRASERDEDQAEEESPQGTRPIHLYLRSCVPHRQQPSLL